MSLRYIRQSFGLDLERGIRVQCEGRLGTITGARGNLVRVKFDGNCISSPCDPRGLKRIGDVSGPIAAGPSKVGQGPADTRI